MKKILLGCNSMIDQARLQSQSGKIREEGDFSFDIFICL